MKEKRRISELDVKTEELEEELVEKEQVSTMCIWFMECVVIVMLAKQA